MKAGRITMIEGAFIQINQDNIDETSYKNCTNAAEDQSKGDYTLNITTRKQKYQIKILKFITQSLQFNSCFLKQKYCSYFNKFENIGVKEYFLDIREMNLLNYYDDFRIFKHLLVYWYTGLFRIQAINIFQVIQLALHFQCYSLIQEIYKKLEQIDFSLLNDDKSIEFLVVHLNQNQFLKHEILNQEQNNKLFDEIFYKLSNENTIFLNKGYKELTQILFEEILKKLISMENWVLQKTAVILKKTELKREESLEIYHRFVSNYIANQNKSLHSQILQVYLKHTKIFYKNVETLQKYSQNFTEQEIFKIFNEIQKQSNQEKDQITQSCTDLSIQLDELKQKHNKLVQYSKCFHLAKSTECEEVGEYFEPECQHKVCLKCFLEYVSHKNNSFHYNPKGRARCLSRFTDPFLCGSLYTQKDFEKLKNFIEINEQPVINQ